MSLFDWFSLVVFVVLALLHVVGLAFLCGYGELREMYMGGMRLEAKLRERKRRGQIK